jgi:DNA-binding transcriptional regulator YiaG
VRPTERDAPEGVNSRIFPSSSTAIEQIREFVEERLRDVLAETRDAPSHPSRIRTDSLQLVIRVLPEHIEVTVGGDAQGVGFRDWLSEVLRRERMSQETAARRLGVSLKTVNRWLRGHSEPRMRELRRVREVFGDPPLS